MKKIKSKEFIIPVITAVYLGLFLLFFLKAMLTDSLDYRLDFMGYGGVFKYHYIHFGSLKISLYWLCHAFGIVGMVALCISRRKKNGYSALFAAVTGILLAILGFAGAKLLYIIENFDRVMSEGISINGVSFFGTVFFMPIALLVVSKIKRIDYGRYIDFCAPSGLLMLICIRTGCFLNGCCHGISFSYRGRPVVFPSQLLECVLDLILLFVLFEVEDRVPSGMLYAVFMGGYGLLRFAVEFTRETDKKTLGMSNGQIFSLICVFIMVIAFAVTKLKRRKAAGRD